MSPRPSPLQCVPIPARMAHLPLDKRGYPVPWIVLRDATGRPHFTINDARRTHDCAAFGLCGICGKVLGRFGPAHGTAPGLVGRGAWFVGGPSCFLSPHGAFLDPPMHFDCAAYALKVCPYLANPSYGKLIDDATLDPAHMPEGTAIIAADQPGTDSRPPMFMLGHARRYQSYVSRGHLLFRVPNPERSWDSFQLWQDGARIPITPENQAVILDRVAALEMERVLAMRVANPDPARNPYNTPRIVKTAKD